MAQTSTTTYQMGAFTESFGVCSPFTYSALLSDGSSLPSIISFDPTTQIFTVDVDDIYTTTTYTVVVTGALNSPYPSSTTTIIFYLYGCTTTVISVPSTISSDYYSTYGDSNNTIDIDAFTETYSGACGPFTYYSTAVLYTTSRLLTSYSNSLPYFLSIDGSTPVMTVNTTGIFSSNNYVVTVLATLP